MSGVVPLPQRRLAPGLTTSSTRRASREALYHVIIYWPPTLTRTIRKQDDCCKMEADLERKQKWQSKCLLEFTKVMQRGSVGIRAWEYTLHHTSPRTGIPLINSLLNNHYGPHTIIVISLKTVNISPTKPMSVNVAPAHWAQEPGESPGPPPHWSRS